MRYFSTRSGQTEAGLKFEQVVMEGLSKDGGLYIPSDIPVLSKEKIDELRNISISFTDLAFEILRMYIDEEEIDDINLKDIIKRSFSTFQHEEVTPLVKLSEKEGKKLYLLELFHGPTFAFKDVALQFLGNVFEFFLKRKNQNNKDKFKLTVIGATSGDTGSAAIYGLRNKQDIDVFILHPEGKVSPIQEAQMTTVLDKNVHNISLKGDFDDCQNIVKELFLNQEFNKKLNLGAVNSINFARILAQTIYYFYSYFAIERKLNQISIPIQYSVPTGNFGDILAGYYAKRMGLNIHKLLIATNKNDILYRTYQSGWYDRKESHVSPSLAPAMDILISSNFERLIWHLTKQAFKYDSNKVGEQVKKWMDEFKQNHKIQFPEEVMQVFKASFDAFRVDDDKTVETIKLYYNDNDKYLLDPHTAIGVKTGLEYFNSQIPTICLATAHPAKFQDAIELAIPNFKTFDNSMYEGYLPKPFYDWMDTQSQKNIHRVQGNDINKVKEYILEALKE